jgi:hypothetical protein
VAWTSRAAALPGTFAHPRRGGDARSIPRIRIPGEHTRDRNVLVGRLAEILKDKRPGRVVAAMFLDMAFGSPIYERLRALGFNNVFEVNFGLPHTPDRAKANMRDHMWGEMKDWLLTGAVETHEKMATDLAGPGYHINRSNLLVIESKADMQKRGQASPDDGDALAPDLRADRGAGESRRAGRRRGIRRVWHQRARRVDAMSLTGTTGVCTYRPQTSRRTPGSGDRVQRDSKGPM